MQTASDWYLTITRTIFFLRQVFFVMVTFTIYNSVAAISPGLNTKRYVLALPGA